MACFGGAVVVLAVLALCAGSCWCALLAAWSDVGAGETLSAGGVEVLGEATVEARESVGREGTLQTVRNVLAASVAGRAGGVQEQGVWAAQTDNFCGVYRGVFLALLAAGNFLSAKFAHFGRPVEDVAVLALCTELLAELIERALVTTCLDRAQVARVVQRIIRLVCAGTGQTLHLVSGLVLSAVDAVLDGVVAGQALARGGVVVPAVAAVVAENAVTVVGEGLAPETSWDELLTAFTGPGTRVEQLHISALQTLCKRLQSRHVNGSATLLAPAEETTARLASEVRVRVVEGKILSTVQTFHGRVADVLVKPAVQTPAHLQRAALTLVRCQVAVETCLTGLTLHGLA